MDSAFLSKNTKLRPQTKEFLLFQAQLNHLQAFYNSCKKIKQMEDVQRNSKLEFVNLYILVV